MRNEPIGGGGIRVCVYPQGDNYVAQCLEHDFATQGTTMEDVEKSLGRIIAAYVDIAIEKGERPFADLDRAPEEFWHKYDAAAQARSSCRVLAVKLVKVHVQETTRAPEYAVLQPI